MKNDKGIGDKRKRIGKNVKGKEDTEGVGEKC